MAALFPDILIRRAFPPFPFMSRMAPFSSNCISLTVRSHISCALAPEAYIRHRSTLSLIPILLHSFGRASSIRTSSTVNTARFLWLAFFMGSFISELLKTHAASKSRFWAYSEKDKSADSLWFFVEALHLRSVSIQVRNSESVA